MGEPREVEIRIRDHRHDEGDANPAGDFDPVARRDERVGERRTEKQRYAQMTYNYHSLHRRIVPILLFCFYTH